MSDAEGLMWRLEKDPFLSSTFANVSILDRRPDMDRLRRRMERAAITVPRLRQRVQPSAANITAPLWVDDPDFDIDHHIRHIALPRPASMRHLLDYASLVAADPFDRTRPLWQFVIVDGLPGGKSAMIEKLHHTIADGETAIAMSLEFLDFERDAPEPPPLPRPEISDADTSPTGADALRDILAGGMRLPIGIVRQIRELLADPAQLPGTSTAAADTLRSILSQLSDIDKARSPLWTARSLRRRIEVLSVPFLDAREAARRLGGTLNTLFLAAAADAAGRYHREQDAPTDALRASMAVSTRTESSGNNAFTLARMLVPTGEMAADERFRAIDERAAGAREGTGTANLETLAAVATALPTSLITRLARGQGQTVDFATSNVRGTPLPVYVAGAQMLRNHPVGPLGGVAFNLTLLSHVGSLDMGVNIDTAAVSDPDLLRSCLDRSFRDLLKWSRAGSSR
jgi:diacylglycerol O-acyltransferase / wax synthase